MSETAKFRNLTTPYCTGCGVDLGPGGDPVTPWAISVDLTDEAIQHYNPGYKSEATELKGDARNLYWFKDGVLDFVYSSGLLEDFRDWDPVLREWVRVLKPGGNLIIAVPDKAIWAEAVRRGQPPNLAHVHESYPGEVSEYVTRLFPGQFEILRDELLPGDYMIVFIARRLK